MTHPVRPTFEMMNKPRTPMTNAFVGAPDASSSSSIGQPPVQVIVTTPNNQAAESPTVEAKATRSASESGAARNGFASLVRNVTGVGASPAPVSPRRGKFDNTSLRIHHGAVDQATVTSGAPPDVFAHVTKVLLSMGLEVQKENDFKYRCIRPKKPKSMGGKDGLGRRASDAGSGYTAFTMVGSAASNGVRTTLMDIFIFEIILMLVRLISVDSLYLHTHHLARVVCFGDCSCGDNPLRFRTTSPPLFPLRLPLRTRSTLNQTASILMPQPRLRFQNDCP